MDEMNWLREDWQDLLVLTEDWIKTEGKEFMSKDYTDFYVGFFTKQHQAEKQYANPLKKGDTVRIVGDVCQGLIGELKVIDPEQEDECFFGVALDAIEGWIFFSADEIERLYSPVEIQTNLAQFFQDVGLYLLKESLYGRVPGIEIKVNMAELPF